MNPCLPDSCRPDEYTAWEDWKACKERVLEAARWSATTDEAQREVALAATPRNVSLSDPTAVQRDEMQEFGETDAVALPSLSALETFIVQYREHMPWQNSTFTAVLPEFRFLEQPVVFVLNNMLNNLPVHWRVQIFAGPSMCNGVRRLFPVETAAGKIVLTDVGDRNYDHAHINVLYTDLDDLYGRLLGDTWLFFQVRRCRWSIRTSSDGTPGTRHPTTEMTDCTHPETRILRQLDSAICSKQRHLLKHFIETKRGWWGAPWE